MPVVPANCVTRLELHQLINRCDVLMRSTVKSELSDSLCDLLASAAKVDGVLADLSEDAGPHANHKGVFDDAWPTQWFSSRTEARDIGLCIELAQQIIKRPSDGSYIGTNRFRLTLDGERYFGSREELLMQAERHLVNYGDRLEERYLQHLLNVFGQGAPNAV